ncbi:MULTISPECIES: hypothetical protein [unclassified Roseofilum]|uniref:hypothetical protein n=1 Tax=unclassified Roseofilum TaxID=2620099 RepID=UPI000E94AA83|nr:MULTISPECIES: hypothetical protein [unclassified Roseofilum]HBQ98886.1 hypothetical protein [Cyanobacteria bacterium UBA11691]MBP0010077.1 hypothetical protein [Roseofilum sp. Belize Diploria]MBP0014790.1 hypothetical protein [Roseofilum sp. SID3]MBP0024151.1 hypothetical protein [Roseofilum sp. SID2]MBP0034477.1 hypothetical protein [Roseofilum sp. Belize BBD 4]
MSQDFFLPPDEAKTFGDIDFMRRKQRVKHTYPKGKRASEVVEASSMEMQIRPESQMMSSTPAKSEPQASSQPSTPTPARRPSNTNTGGLDFLKMAKGMKKK